MELKWTATREGRLSSFLLGELKMSTGLMNKLKWGDSLRVNGVPQRTNYPVAPGDVITVALAEETPEYPAEDGELSILYEDDALLAVDKPAGMLIHPSRARNTGTLANFVAGYYQKTGQNCAFHPMTRLDRDTFGIVLLAKNSHIHALLQQEKPRKTYHALVFGGPQEDAGTVNAPIAVKYSKACIDRGMQMDIDDGIALENELFAMCYATADQKEGMGAFLEKRKEKHFQNK